jgi:hypothetical protein
MTMRGKPLSKRILMLSTAAVALLTSAALADTTLTSSDSKTDPYTTGALLSGQTGTADAGNITIQSGGQVNVKAAQGAITINTNNWVLQQGTLTNKDNDGASAIHAVLSVNPDYTGTSMVTNNGTVSATGIYLDSNSSTSVTGSGTGKFGIYLDTSTCSAVCTFKGAITQASNSYLSVSGDKSIGIQIGSTAATATTYGVVDGNILLAGSTTVTADTTSDTATGVFGLLSYGQIKGNLTLDTTGAMVSYGHGAVGMAISGMGMTGALSINGTLQTSVLNTNNNYDYYSKVNTTTNPEAGAALDIGASVVGGISIGGPSAAASSTVAGAISMAGSDGAVTGTTGAGSTYPSNAAVVISPSLATIQPTGPLTVGEYADATNPGFSFYNRGTVTAQYTNYNKPTTAIFLSGGGLGFETILSGGLYSSGTVQASAVTSNDASASSGVHAYGLVIGDYVKLLPNETKKNAPGSGNDPGDQAALVISGATAGAGTIQASVSGTRGGIARAIWIYGPNSSVPSLINTGTITAAATTTTTSLAGNLSGSNDPLQAVAIQDDSGTLASIVNSGTISASAGYMASGATTASAIDNDSQFAYAIYLAGNDTGTTIKNYATATKSAVIAGDIYFGAGANQVLDLIGTNSNASTVAGNVTYGYSTDANSVDRLHIGMNSMLTGKVITNSQANGVQVDVDAFGTLNLLNTDVALRASTVTVARSGTLNLGVNRQLTSSGMVTADAVSFANGANLGVTYASFLPKQSQATGSYQFVLMSSNIGQMTIGQSVIDTFNNKVDSSNNSTRPYLLKTAQMCNTGNGACGSFAKPDSTRDYLLIDVQMKTPAEIGLNARSIAVTAIPTDKGTTSSLFQQANLALAVDDVLGSAFLTGIHNAKEAAQAYNDMAPGVTGGTRAIAISITDSATGPVAARQRALRMYGKTNGDFTIWGQEFVQMIKDPGTGDVDSNTGFKTNPGFKDHGFGLSLGIDGGSPKYGWYGGALTFYAGDVNELSRTAHQNQQWYLLSLYSAWRGKGLFLDTKIDAGYGHIDGKRTLTLFPTSSTYYIRQADNTHAGALISGSVVTGAMFSYGAATFMPQFNLDAMYLREEGYTEHNPTTTTVGDGFDLKVGQYYAKSLRAFLGFNARYDLKLFDIYLQPEVRAGYRYDFVNDPVKLKAAFAYADTSAAHPTAGDTFELTGPDPSRGNFVLGGSISTTTDTWTLGLNFDLVKGENGAFQQVGIVHILGRI